MELKMQKKTKKQKTFDKQMLTATIPANLIAAATVFTYGLITMQLSLSYLWPAIKLVVPLVAVAQFLIAPFIDGIFTNNEFFYLNRCLNYLSKYLSKIK